MVLRARKGSDDAKRPSTTAARLSGDLIVLAGLIGISRALFGSGEPRAMQRAGAEPSFEGRGGSAESPSQIPVEGWLDVAWRVINCAQNDRVLLVAAGVTFYGLLALFPATTAVVSLYGLFTDAAALNDHLQLISGFLPQGALEVIGEQVHRITSQGQGRLGFAFLGSLVFSLWGANAGTKAIFDSLNIIYKEREKRSFIQLTMRSLAFTLGGIVLVLIAIAGIVIVPVAFKVIGIPEGSTPALLSLLRWPLLYAALLFALACLYRFGPSRAHPQWRWVTWGSAVAAGIWLIGSLLLSWYVANFGSYNATYGSLGAVIGCLMWMWLSTVIVLGGAEINAEMEPRTAKDTTEGRNKPRGSREARMADELGEARA